MIRLREGNSVLGGQVCHLRVFISREGDSVKKSAKKPAKAPSSDKTTLPGGQFRQVSGRNASKNTLPVQKHPPQTETPSPYKNTLHIQKRPPQTETPSIDKKNTNYPPKNINTGGRFCRGRVVLFPKDYSIAVGQSCHRRVVLSREGGSVK